MSYPTLEEVKDYLGITTTDDDDIISSIMVWTEELIAQYLGRNVDLAEYTQESYKPNTEQLQLRNYPVVDVTSLTVDGTVIDSTEYHVSKEFGIIYYELYDCDVVSIVYNGGYDPLPGVIESVFYGIVNDRYDDYKGVSDSEIKDVTLFDFAKVSYDTSTASGSGGISYSGVGAGNDPEPLVGYLGQLDLYRSNWVLLNAGGVG